MIQHYPDPGDPGSSMCRRVGNSPTVGEVIAPTLAPESGWCNRCLETYARLRAFGWRYPDPPPRLAVKTLVPVQLNWLPFAALMNDGSCWILRTVNGESCQCRSRSS